MLQEKKNLVAVHNLLGDIGKNKGGTLCIYIV
ncbi:hypothetical protein ES708_30927 [subsurface metagenome]